MDDEKAAEKVNQVLTWILEGNSEHAIRDAIFATWPDESDTPLIVAAFRQVAESAEKTRGTVEDWCIESMRFLYQKQVEIGDYGGAMRAISELKKLATGRRPAEAAVQHEGDFPRMLNADDRRRQLAERIARIG